MYLHEWILIYTVSEKKCNNNNDNNSDINKHLAEATTQETIIFLYDKKGDNWSNLLK